MVSRPPEEPRVPGVALLFCGARTRWDGAISRLPATLPTIMISITRRSLLPLVAIAVIAAAMSAVLLRVIETPANSPRAVLMRTASADSLAAAGIRLTAPDATPLIDRAAAEQTALRANPGGSVREAVFARVDDDHAQNPEVHCVCWVVSIMHEYGLRYPSNGPPGNPSTPAPPTYEIEIIDGTTGGFIEGVIGA